MKKRSAGSRKTKKWTLESNKSENDDDASKNESTNSKYDDSGRDSYRRLKKKYQSITRRLIPEKENVTQPTLDFILKLTSAMTTSWPLPRRWNPTRIMVFNSLWANNNPFILVWW